MATVEFKVDDRTLANLQRVLNPKQLQSALRSAVVRTTNAAVRIASGAVREKTTIPQKYIADKKNRYAAIKSKIRNDGTPVGHLIVRDIPLPLSAFKFRDSKVNGVTVDFGSIDEPITLKHAFAARVQSKRQAELGVSHLAILTRAKVDPSGKYNRSPSKLKAKQNLAITPKGYAWRLPIKEHFGRTVLDYITANEIRTEVETKIGNEFQKQIDSQISRFTQGRFSTLADAVATLALSDPTTDSNTDTTNG